MSTAQATMAFIQEPSDKSPQNEAAVVEQVTLKRRVRDTGARHGKAFGSIGVVTTSYVQGFAEGFVASFKD